MFGIGILEIVIFSAVFLVVTAAGVASALMIIKMLQQR